jgi:D-sedoheptulose 7-phosphate isomerase
VQLALAIKQAKKVYVIGNGGSAANAMHIINDLLACGIKAYTLDMATLTASANDHGYETVFSRWIGIVGEPDDLLIALSGSGNSVNILKALVTAKALGMKTWAICGNMNPVGKAIALADNRIVKGASMQAAEEAQLAVGHEVMRWLKRNS